MADDRKLAFNYGGTPEYTECSPDPDYRPNWPDAVLLGVGDLSTLRQEEVIA